MRSAALSVILIILNIALISCTNAKNPVMTVDGTNPNQDISRPVVSDAINDSETNSNRGVFGAWKVRVDATSLTAEVIPARSAKAIGNIFDADLSQFLTVSPCSNCLRIPRLMIDAYGDLLIEVGMKHPFANITARPDLHCFDVRAIFISSYTYGVIYPGIQVLKPDNTTQDAVLNDSWDGFLNADGYTNDYDWLPTDTRYFISGTDLPGNLNPFLRYFEDYDTGAFDPHAPSGHNVMAVGDGYYSKIAEFSHYLLESSTILEFYVVADVAYGQSAVLANRANPQYYLPAFNRTEPWKVEYWTENNNLLAGDTTSTADLVVQVCDWQQGATVDPSYPNPSNLSGIAESSNVLQLELSVPHFQDTPIIVTAPESGTGTPTDPLQYRLPIINTNGATANVSGLLAVRDELHGHASPSGRRPIPASPAGFPYETRDLLDYTYYLPVVINFKHPMIMFSLGNTEINGELFYNYGDTFAKFKQTVIKPDFFMDLGHRKFQNRWDFDYDGLTFDVDGGGMPSPTIEFPTGGRYTVGLRTRTNSVPPREYLYKIPVFSQGEAFKNTLPDAGTQTIKTSATKNHSAYITKNGVAYIIYPYEAGGVRNIKLAKITPHGDAIIRDVTNDANVKFYPSLTVIEEGVNAGVYVAYSRVVGGDAFIIADKADLNGNGFASLNTKRVTTSVSAWEIYPIITYYKNVLHIYYMDTAVFASILTGVHSDDFNDSWIEDGAIVNNGSIYQYWQTIAPDEDYLFLIWADSKDYTTNGSDLYMAQSSDGTTFTNIQNISTRMGKIWDVFPSAANYRGQIGIAYQSYPDGSDERDIYLKIYNRVNGSISDYLIADSDGTTVFTQPAVGCSSERRFVVAYGDLNTSTHRLSAEFMEVVSDGPLGYFYTGNIYSESMGIVDPALFDIFPVIASHSPQLFSVENFLAWTDYKAGFKQSADTPTEYYGDLKNAIFITEKFENVY